MAERRKHKRLPIRLPLFCQRVGLSSEKSYLGTTVNVSTGGLLFMSNSEELTEGDLLMVELSVPPTAGLLEFGGRISSFARVLRSTDVQASFTTSSSLPARRGIAVQFCQPPKYWP